MDQNQWSKKDQQNLDKDLNQLVDMLLDIVVPQMKLEAYMCTEVKEQIIASVFEIFYRSAKNIHFDEGKRSVDSEVAINAVINALEDIIKQ
ncbi:UNKNOWN [Stylonychia lemnae]|uniref:Uncharacterized protein n=1 Tax=Stylonychia lemnae TaxID=5949 RepID=A0A078AKX7_STYLE|nr:UNKNOWN [Stylonychia lemnae]|eukprot:CDW81478.1 UNKNOWN [Stylonychia lemnae]